MAPPSYGHAAAVVVSGGGVVQKNAAVSVVETAAAASTRLLDADEFRRQGHQVVEFIADYYDGMGEYPVHPSVSPGFLRRLLPAEAPWRPEEPDAFAAALRDHEKTANELNRTLLEEVNAVESGPYMSSANAGGVYMLRCAVGSTLTEERHVREAWKVVQDRATFLLRKMEITA
uniref:Uncharacterized protein n=1 Tax=Oryza brachyantha TaxID=4533 RepID=J3N1U0_ORYBR